MLNSRAFPGYWYGFPCVLESHGGRSMRRKGELVCPPVSSSHGQTPLAEAAKQQQLRSRRCTLQAMPSVQGGTVTAEMLCPTLGKQDFELPLSDG